MKVVVIIPTYNEKGNIERIVPITEEVFKKIKNHDMAILVADDNSPDGTAEAVTELAKKYKNIDLSSGPRYGLGAAYVRGMTYAIEEMEADIVFEMDADLQHDPEKIPEFLAKMEEGYDMVIGTRYSEGGSIPAPWPIHRKIFSVFGNLLIRIIMMRFWLHDWTGGFRALKKEVFLKEKDELTEFKGYTFQVSFLHKAIRDGFKIGEVPFHFGERNIGDSKIAPMSYIANLLKYVIFARIMELKRIIKFLIVGGTGFIVQILTQELFARVIFSSLTAESIRDGFSAGFGAESAIISNFMFNNFWTFKDTKKIKQNSTFLVRLIKFNLASFMSIAIQSLSVYVFVNLLGGDLHVFDFTIKTRIAVLIPTIVFFVIPLNYIIYNKIIWKTQYLKNESADK
mgnify:CR=1 FL=1